MQWHNLKLAGSLGLLGPAEAFAEAVIDAKMVTSSMPVFEKDACTCMLARGHVLLSMTTNVRHVVQEHKFARLPTEQSNLNLLAVRLSQTQAMHLP